MLRRVVSISLTFCLSFVLFWKNNPAENERYIAEQGAFGAVQITEDITKAKKFNSMPEAYDFQNTFHYRIKKDYAHGFDMHQWYIKYVPDEVANSAIIYSPGTKKTD